MKKKVEWVRVCCRCNGLIFKGEGKYVDSVNYGKRHFMQHKSVELCKQRHKLRNPAEIEALAKIETEKGRC